MNVLVVDDEPTVRELFEDALEDTGARLTCERSGFRAMARVNEQPFDLIFMDLMMPGLDGLRTIEEVQRLRPGARIIMITGYATEAILNEALAKGAESCMHKPFGASEIREAVCPAKKRLEPGQ